jgi:uncharacterized membrane protein YeaQ/YmgE (transglycosylase-associated protein family)
MPPTNFERITMKNYQILKLPTIALGAVVGGFASFFYWFYFQNEMMTNVFGEGWHQSDMLVTTCQPMIFMFMTLAGSMIGIRVSEFVFSRLSKDAETTWLSHGPLFFTALGAVAGGWFGRQSPQSWPLNFFDLGLFTGAYVGAFVLLVIANTIACSSTAYHEEIELAQ